MRYRRQMIGMFCAMFLTVGLSGRAFAAALVGPGVKKEPESASETFEVFRLKAAAETSQIILAVGDGSLSSLVTVSFYQKNEAGDWQEIFSVPGYCGYHGITEDKKEGDRKTPAGEYQFTMAFGVYENPGSKLSYRQVQNSDYWVDDSASSYYNRLVNTDSVPVSWNSAEHLIDIVPQYHYSLALNYNEECLPNKGSAIFLHGYHSFKTWTEGCIAVPEENMKLLMQTVDSTARIIIAASPEDLAKHVS